MVEWQGYSATKYQPDSSNISGETQGQRLSINEIKLYFKTNAAQSIRSNGTVKTNVLGI
jgi:hypothetical protein